MKKELESARNELWAYVKSNNRVNRRAVIGALKLVEKACKRLGIAPLDKTRPPSNAQQVAYPKTDEAKEVQDLSEGPVLADNSTPETGPERPRRGRKAKTV